MKNRFIKDSVSMVKAASMACAVSAFQMLCADSCFNNNLLENPGFENIDDDGDVLGWDEPRKTFSYAKGEGRNGSTALKFSIGRKGAYSFPSQKVKVEPLKRYRFSAWVRTKNLAGVGNGASIFIRCADSNDQRLVNATVDGVRGTVGEWRRVSSFVDTPAGAATCEISPYVTKRRHGTAWFDDLTFHLDERPVLFQVSSDVYRDTAADGIVTVSAPLSLSQTELTARGMKVVFDIIGWSGSVKTIDGTIDGLFARVRIDVGRLEAGKSKIAARLIDATGKNVERTEFEFTRVPEKPDWKVCTDRQNRFIVDGKSFFPMGIYLTYPTDEALDDIFKSPFNCVLCYKRLNREQMDRFHAAGKKVIYSIKGVYVSRESCPKEIKDEESERKWVANHVRSLKDHPALLAWYINDEMAPSWVNSLKRRHELVKSVDPDHPTFMVLYQIDHLREYAGTYDILGTDPYPIGARKPRPISMVEDWTRRTVRDAMGKAVLQVPQIFDNEVQNKVRPVKAPTEAEMKNMLWQCVAAGANGVCAFSYTSLRRKDKKDPFEKRWAEVCRVYGEFADYLPVFLSSEKVPEAKGVPEGVLARTFRHESRNWLLTVNTTQTPAVCSLSVGDGSSVKVNLEALGVDFRRLPESCDDLN